MNGVYREVIKGIQIMKNISILIALFLFASMSTAIYASESDGNNSNNGASGASSKDDICWEGSNSGNQHDPITADPHTVGGVVCPPNDEDPANGRPPKHCTHTNKNGNKHKDSASGC
ncbi:MAG: hypothetical protein ACI9N9_002994 [Enterobacterales bacterium]|jgi:hypothetical protein